MVSSGTTSLHVCLCFLFFFFLLLLFFHLPGPSNRLGRTVLQRGTCRVRPSPPLPLLPGQPQLRPPFKIPAHCLRPCLPHHPCHRPFIFSFLLQFFKCIQCSEFGGFCCVHPSHCAPKVLSSFPFYFAVTQSFVRVCGFMSHGRPCL